MRKILDYIFGIIFIGIIAWILLSAFFGYADWLNSSPNNNDFERVPTNYPH